MALKNIEQSALPNGFDGIYYSATDSETGESIGIKISGTVQPMVSQEVILKKASLKYDQLTEDEKNTVIIHSGDF